LAAMLLMASCLLSFLSMRSHVTSKSKKLELIADYAFLVALVCISITIIVVSFNLMK
jgi:hypothetical protein